MAQSNKTSQTAYEFTFHGLGGEGDVIRLSDYAGRGLVVVNTASQCGFTPQYKGLEKLWQEWRDQGLMVVGVPSNDFGGQEPGADHEIREFCELKYHVTFPMCSKTPITGDGAHPFYKWVDAQVGILGRPRWNFYKYVISREGNLVDWFSSLTKPESPALAKAVRQALAA